MKHWIIAAGSDGFMWDEFRSEDNIRLGFDEFDAGDLSEYATKKELVEKAKAIGESAKSAGMLWNFYSAMKEGDYVFVRHAFQRLLGVGIVSSPYRHEPNRQIYLHVRDVHWIHTEPQPMPESINFARDAIRGHGHAFCLFGNIPPNLTLVRPTVPRPHGH
jgi:predicted Mrr-cat superfamily restriction endonuclease